jgi:hypothetical protein
MDRAFKNKDGTRVYYNCPGCGNVHGIDPNRWSFNGDLVNPTFTPSVLCNPDHLPSRCHHFVTDGNIKFLSDCHHELKGKTVPLPIWEESW